MWGMPPVDPACVALPEPEKVVVGIWMTLPVSSSPTASSPSLTTVTAAGEEVQGGAGWAHEQWPSVPIPSKHLQPQALGPGPGFPSIKQDPDPPSGSVSPAPSSRTLSSLKSGQSEYSRRLGTGVRDTIHQLRVLHGKKG